MKYNVKYSLSLLVFLCITANGFSFVFAQTSKTEEQFEKVQILTPVGEKVSEISVRVRFLSDEMLIESVSDGKMMKTFKYSTIKDAEYTYSKSPRWKTGLGLGAASIVFLPLLLVAIPVGFTKHRRHWLTIKTENDYAVLKLSKSNRKLIIPAFETKTGVVVTANGESK